MLDLLLRGGTLVDGTGRPARRADIGVRDGRVVTVTEPSDPEGSPSGETAADVIDVTGLVVAPGFVDPHTHYDAQLFWDPLATPSNLHGVTTIIGGNCGFTLAPLAPGDGDYLRRMMAKVEGMPLVALEDGLPWTWESFGDYLEHLDGRIGVNAGFLVGHCALRRKVMGADAVGEEASPEQLAAMVELLHDAIRSGGLGFSSTQSQTHSDGDGRPVASRWATRDELLALSAVVADHEGTTLEFIVSGCLDKMSDDEIDLLVDMSVAGQRPLNWNVLTVDSAVPDRHTRQLSAGTRAKERGGRIVALTMPVLVGMTMSLGHYCALHMLPGWGDVMALPVPERIRRLRDPAVRAAMRTGAASDEAGILRRLTDWANYELGDTYAPENEGLEGRRVGDVAAERGLDPFDVLVDVCLADELRTVLWPLPTDDDDESWAIRAEVWRDDRALLGGSDAGAHLDRMCGAPYTTAFLGDCLRGRRLVPLEEAVRLLTDVPARLFGLRDRGRIEEGAHADLVVFDPETVGASRPRMVEDLPGGTPRLWSDAIGVPHVVVGGTPIVRDGVATGALPGTVLRSGRDTETVLP
jgi:N-acyl-D-aspartate/D-glutamate deacylase